jgi:uncharacterized membrane protein (DUF106 family)
MGFLTQMITWMNVLTNALGRSLLAPIALLPGWLSNTIISAVVGMVLLVIFKYTSNQHAIGRIREHIAADLLTLRLFKDSMVVTLQAQGRLLKGAFQLLFHALRPMLVMIIPVSLLLAQMGLWYQFRPLRPGEQTVVTMKLNGDASAPWPDVRMEPTRTAHVVVGPVCILSKREICWEVRAGDEMHGRLSFRVDGQRVDKELAIGEGFVRVSAKRPGWNWADVLTHPEEKPFGPDSVVKSITVDYPRRLSKASGTDWWLVYFFIASLVVALVFRPFLKVRI